MSFEVARDHKAHMKRMRLSLRRRREGKTDYQQRHNLIRHNKSNYGEVKSRFVVRITSSKVICQIIQAYSIGDKVVCAADSSELKKYGITFGLKNYSAAYATGFLCARKMLTKLGLANEYTGKEELDGEVYLEEDNEEGPKAFRCYLDLGLARATKGAKVFSAMKGACDGGLYIPHSPSKFAGFSTEDKELDAEALKERIFGGHVANYMRELEESDNEAYQARFADYIKNGITADSIEQKYAEAFDLIRKDTFEKTKRTTPIDRSPYQHKPRKLTNAERKERAQAKFQLLAGEVEAEN
ncbi:large subunit ribosomal protein L5e [Nematocida minor]|uniref:large subunit ribosomal protein L5e n=1 Tax=Nematocida minor TaxID=1912983 RepID=UPI0022209147|nr:large subunit ribosomal protein L5e [Nematocida minor]KAI5190015.1 large subunit ribosomal protein L5e [Nematocida minor]